MIIPIDDKYRIKSSTETWDIQRSSLSKQGVTYWESIKYFGKLSTALSALFELKVRASDAEGLDECIQEARRIFKEITAVIDRGEFTLDKRAQEEV